uniref:Retrovirus-related Pol polyprotein from transposon TNT 1-94 n=1 Tax=Tanacetum cinerariifolium TaxID=118510 RepID=A0A6L2L8Z7_TANCI|nr:hypothetical protein [Tanacetum cinerariifolium]
MYVLVDDQMNSVINCLTAKSTWDDLILYHEAPSDVKETRVMDQKLCYNTFKFKEDESLTQTFTRYKALMNELDEEKVSYNDNEVTEVKALMAFADEERVFVSKKSARNGEWIKISMKKAHTLLEMKYNDDRKSFLDYLCIDLKYAEEQRNNLTSKHRNLVQEQNTCKEQLLVLKQAKLDLLTMQHVNTKILKENQKLRNELKELTSITKAWLNSSNKVNQCISEQIPTQKKKILGINQLTEDTFSSEQKYLVFVKSLIDNSEVSITSSNKPKLSEAEDSTLSNHDTGKMNLQSVAPLSSTREADCYDHDTHGHNKIISLRRGIKPRNPQHVRKNCETYGSNVYTTSDHIDIDWFKKREALQAKKAESFKASKTESSSALRSKIPTKRGILINKERYVMDLLGQYEKIGSSVSTLIVPPNMLGPDLNGKPINETQYRGFDVEGYLDFDCAGCSMDTMFSAEAEDVAVAGCCANILWIKSQLTNYDIIYEKILDKPSFKRLIDELDIIIKLNKRHREKVVPYTRFLSLLMMHKMKEGYGDGKVTPYPTQVFSVNNWALKPNQPEEPLFTEHMLAICNVAEPLLFKAPKPSSNAKRVPQGTKPEAKPGHKKHSTSSKQPYVSSKEATKGDDALAISIAEADPGKYAPSDFVPQKKGMNKRTKNTSYDYLFAGTDLHVLEDKTPYVEEDEATRTIKLEDLVKLVSSVQPSFKDLDSPKDDPIIVVDDSDEDEEAEKVHATTNVKTKDTLVPKSSSPMSS